MRVISLICNPEADAADRPTKEGWVDIGEGFQYMEVCEADDDDETPTGILLQHIGCLVNDGCMLHVPFDTPENQDVAGPKWKLESIYPLTISPSVVVNECKAHGWIKEGQWSHSGSPQKINNWNVSDYYL